MDKARLITDMMIKMQSKIKDSNLRSIDHKQFDTGFDFEGVKKVKKPHSIVDDEEYKFGHGKIPQSARQRKYSSQQDNMIETRDFQQKPTNSFKAFLHSAIGGSADV